MVTQILHRIKRGVRHGPVRVFLERTGVLTFGRGVYNNMLLRKGTAHRDVCGEPLVFAIHSTFEITEIDGMFDEDEFIRRILDSLQPGDVFYDVGANIGIVALAAARRGRAAGVHVCAFEPEPGNIARLRDNVRLNALMEFIDVEPVGLGREPGHTELVLAEGEFAGGSHSIAHAGVSGKSVAIELDSVDRRVRDKRPVPTVMKIDVEGAEMEVLLGSEELLSRQGVRELFIEVHIGRIFTDGFDPPRMQQWLEAKGFRLVWSRSRGTEIHQHYART